MIVINKFSNFKKIKLIEENIENSYSRFENKWDDFRKELRNIKNDSRNKTSKGVILNFAKSSWCYGSSKIVTASNWFYQSFWLIAVFACSIFGLYVVVNNIRDYYQYKVVTETKTVEVDSLVLPQVTVCEFSINLNGNIRGFDSSKDIPLKYKVKYFFFNQYSYHF